MPVSERSLIVCSVQELRERILDATLEVIRERGMARTRTNAIARAAGCAEGSIYRYFSGKPELLHEVVRTRLPRLIDVLLGLPRRAGTGTVRANLLEVALAASAFYEEVVALYAGVIADAELLDQRSNLFLRELEADQAAGALADYLRAEQQLGRIHEDADPDAAAQLLLASCLGESCLRALLHRPVEEAEREGSARTLVRLMIRALEPAGGDSPCDR
jgi:AcrR family transcriptional regulator